MLIQTHFPTFASDTKQSTIVDATADASFHAIRHADFSRSRLSSCSPRSESFRTASFAPRGDSRDGGARPPRSRL